MDEQITIAAENEQQLKNEMLFTLSQRVSGTLATIVTANEKQQKELQSFLKQHLKEYQFYNLDLTAYSYTSLHKALTELLPEHIQRAGPAEWLINITGLENNVYKSEHGKIEYSSLLPQLNFERELLFNQPHILVLWISKSFDSELRKKAPDLVHWLSKRFVFAGENMNLENVEEVLDKGQVQEQGRIAKRTERIIELEATWEKLCMDDANKERLIKDKIYILMSLGIEYREAFDFTKSEEALKKALLLSERISMKGQFLIASELGDTYLKFNKLNDALLYYQQSMQTQKELHNENYFSAQYRKIGDVYRQQRNWVEALANYQKEIEWDIKKGNEFQVGDTYNQIGIVYALEGKWTEALYNYQKAIDLKTKSGNVYGLGSVYHQIGMVYDEQDKWPEALVNYRKAIDLITKSGDVYKLGGTYHQIGNVYLKQRKWNTALENYQHAIEWRIKTGNEFDLGGTYYQIGTLYTKQRNWPKALYNYQKAIDWQINTGNEFNLSDTYLMMAGVYKEQREWPQALENYNKAINWFTGTDNVFYIPSIYFQIREVYKELGEFEKAEEFSVLVEQFKINIFASLYNGNTDSNELKGNKINSEK